MKISRGRNDFNPDEPESVVEACKNNDASAQRALIRLYYGYVKSISLRYSSDDQDAEEIINDSFLKVFNNLDKYNEKQAFKSWLRAIVVNTAIDYFRKNKQRPVFSEYEEAEKQHISDLNEDIISSISAEEILALVRQLSPVYRMVFSMYVIDGYAHKEIAEKLGIKEGTSKSNLQDARRKLQSMIFKVYPKLYAAYELKTLPQNED
jgi:RNA polymerase sigma-70 factor (ECF subfamily)